MTANQSLRTYFRSHTLRDMLIGMISDSFKDAYGYRPRFDHSQDSLVDLWRGSRHYEEVARESADRWEAMRGEEMAWYLQAEQEAALWAEVGPTQWDYVADRLEGVRIWA